MQRPSLRHFKSPQDNLLEAVNDTCREHQGTLSAGPAHGYVIDFPCFGGEVSRIHAQVQQDFSQRVRVTYHNAPERALNFIRLHTAAAVTFNPPQEGKTYFKWRGWQFIFDENERLCSMYFHTEFEEAKNAVDYWMKFCSVSWANGQLLWRDSDGIIHWGGDQSKVPPLYHISECPAFSPTAYMEEMVSRGHTPISEGLWL